MPWPTSSIAVNVRRPPPCGPSLTLHKSSRSVGLYSPGASACLSGIELSPVGTRLSLPYVAMVSNPVDGGADALCGRTARAADHRAENQALVALARAQTGPRQDLLQSIADTALSPCRAGSAGISLIEDVDGKPVFRWLAVSGMCAALQGKTTAWDECPCGVTLESGAPRLFVRPQEQFACLAWPGVDVPEGIVVPIQADGEQLGAIWVMSHTNTCRFDLEDVRLLTDLSVFAGSALAVVNARDSGQETDRQHNEFIAMLGHELRNPMTPIDGAITTAMRLCSDKQQAVDVLRIAHRQMKHLRALVDDLLDAARVKYNKIAIRYSDTLLNDIVSDAVKAVSHHIESHRHVLRINGLDNPVHVHADHVRLTQVLGNLLSNAAKYTPTGGTIELNVGVEQNPSHDGPPTLVTLSVVDNGIGIDAAVKPHIFELFTQPARSRSRSDGGLGIGLAVARRMVELHNGTISVHSEGAGRGTRVTIRLPILRAPDDAKAERPAKARVSQAADILLVDDNIDALEVLGLLIELEGHQVTKIDNGVDAISLMSERHPSVAIVDIGMPEMNGLELARAIRQVREFDDTLLIALTGYASESDKCSALAAGFDHHLTKPLSLDRLRLILSNREYRSRAQTAA